MNRPVSSDRATDRISVSTIASTPVYRLPAERSCEDAWFDMRPEALDMDVALIDAPSGSPPLIVKRDPRWREESRSVIEYAEPVAADCRISPDEPLRNALGRLATQRYLLCAEADAVTGIVTATDLHKPGARLVALGILLAIEEAITLLFPSLTNRRWREYLSEGQRKSLEGEIAKRKRNGTYLSDEDSLLLPQKLAIARQVMPAMLEISKTEWRSLTAAMIMMRNDVAHGRALLNGRLAPDKTLERLIEFDKLGDRLWHEVLERSDVWDKYAATQCSVWLDGKRVLVQDARARLPNRFWMLSAQNPFERILTDEINHQRHQALIDDLKWRDALFAEGIGKAPGDDGWSETMAVARGIDRTTACEISRRYGQRSVFEFEGEVFRVVEVESGQVRREWSIARSAG